MIDRNDWMVLERLQAGIPLCPRPFAEMASDVGIEEGEFLQRVQRLHAERVIRRLGPRVRHHRIGIEGNIMVVWRVPEKRKQEVGELFAASQHVSHCYLRPPFEGFPYNLYTMIHARDVDTAKGIVAELAEASALNDYLLLPTVRELKKTTPRYLPPQIVRRAIRMIPMITSKSEALFEEAQKLLPGGVNSPVRAFRSVGGVPRFISHGKGSRLWDVDGNEYIDLVMSWGPLILGHADERVTTAACAAVGRGSSFGAPTALEVRMAELILECFPSMDLVRMVNSGTEAVMSAIRVARAFTGRDKIIKFDGCWHGHADGLLVKAGSTGLQYAVPDSAGVPASYAEQTLVARFNDLDTVRALIDEHPDQVACLIVEPVAGNMGVVPPAAGFLQGLREITAAHGIVLLFDEVITGFRVARGGAQQLYGVTPDMTTLGKIVGGGFPVGAYGGKREIMERVSPLGPAVQAGTLAGNPVAMAAGIAVLEALAEKSTYVELERKSAALAAGLSAAAADAGVSTVCNRVGSMMTTFFSSAPIANADDIAQADKDAYSRYFHGMLERGVYMAPSYCEAAFLSTAHTDEDVQTIIAAAREAFPLARG